MKKLCIITCGFEGTGGGKIASILENAFSKEYETVTLIGFHDQGVYPIKGKKLYLGRFGKREFPGRGLVALIPHIVNTIRYIRKEEPDIVITIGTYCNFLGLIAKKFIKFKLLLTQHEHITTKQKNNSTLLDKLEIKLIKKIIGKTKIVCVSNEVMKDTISYYNLPKEQAYTIYNGLDIDNILRLSKEKININEKYIMTIGTLDSNKNQELIIRAYNKSKIKGKYSLYILGDGEKKEYLNELTKTLGLEGKVKLLGYQNNPYKYLANASLFCFASKSESFGLVLAEALLFGLPIITTPIPSANEILCNGKYGLILKDYSIKGYIQGLNNFYNNTIKNYDSKLYVENNFGITNMTRNYINLVNSLYFYAS